jgi:hypothetical protein
MPNYEVVNITCVLRKKQVRCPAILESDSGATGKFGDHINDCFGKDAECKKTGCKFSGGTKEPFAK